MTKWSLRLVEHGPRGDKTVYDGTRESGFFPGTFMRQHWKRVYEPAPAIPGPDQTPLFEVRGR